MDSQILLEQLYKLEWLLRRYYFYSLRQNGPMATPHRGQGRILALLKIKPEISQKELSTILDIRAQSLGELLVKLEKAGYITRKQSEEDRRVMEIKLTEAGRRAAESAVDDNEGEELFGCLNEKEQEILSKYIGRLIEHLEKILSQESAGKDYCRRAGVIHRGFDLRDFEASMKRGLFGRGSPKDFPED
ncbi:MarR family winged helix-turn-helix transcriptional regulator [Gracilinema caldarium]|uniref:MarR family winged helix-turn-helix transcriptional regulator n=1 Tax=Gracilinema caldarium TaxID=215591 RepID=UPI0026F01A6A|nr:MarR family transcriptional regulator [Gracilinema caldarium]